MEIKRLITNFIYRIEPKPEGGFIARASDPNVPPLEAPTREELQQKIQAAIMANLAAQFPALQLPLQNQGNKFNFHIESKPEGGFALHSAEPGVQPVEGTQELIESHFAEKLIGLAEKVSPELRQALAAQGASGNVKVFVNGKADITLGTGSRNLSFSLGRGAQPAGAFTADVVTVESAKSGETIPAGSNLGGSNMMSNAPITPERSGSASVFFFLLGIVILGALAYFILHPH